MYFINTQGKVYMCCILYALLFPWYVNCGGKQWQTTPKNLPRMQCARAISVT